MGMRKRRMVRMPNRDEEEEGSRMNPYSPAGIYVTASVKAQCILIAQNRKMKGGGEDQEHKDKCSEKGRPYESAR